jgi:hypothetical protein
MTSLTEAYQGNARDATSLRRLYAGAALVLLGAGISVLTVLLPTTEFFTTLVADVTTWETADHYASVRVAGVLAGVGVPMALIGVFIVFPAGRRMRAAGAIGASLCLLSVVLFWGAYPHHWRGYGADLTLEVSTIYLLGLFVAVWCLFVGVVDFKTWNDPGGSLEMNVTRENHTVVEVVESDTSGLGSVGVLGETPDGDVDTQTNVDKRNGRGTRTASDSGSGVARTSVEAESTLDGDAEIIDDRATEPEPTDRYCGN